MFKAVCTKLDSNDGWRYLASELSQQRYINISDPTAFGLYRYENILSCENFLTKLKGIKPNLSVKGFKSAATALERNDVVCELADIGDNVLFKNVRSDIQHEICILLFPRPHTGMCDWKEMADKFVGSISISNEKILLLGLQS